MASNTELLAKIDALEARLNESVDPAKVAAHAKLIADIGAPPDDAEVSARHTAAERKACIASLSRQDMVDVILKRGWFPYHGHPNQGNPNRPNKMVPEFDDDNNPVPVSVHKNMAKAMVDSGVAEAANPFA